jgi:anti-sigma regulatory factor (Ser/Thr protein kinase)
MEPPKPMTAPLVLHSDPEEWPRLQAFAEGFAETNALAAEERSRLLIVLEELLTNLVKHGYDAPGTGEAEVSLALAGGTLVIVFADDGRAFDPLAHVVSSLDASVEERPVGGLGIHLFRAFADEAHYSREGERNRLTLMRRLGRRPRRPPLPNP